MREYAVPVALGAVVLLLVVLVLQVHRLEQRFIAQGQQLRVLGEATERLSAGGIRVDQKGQSVAPTDPNVKVLHPDVENFLKPADTRWPPAGASLDGTLLRGWDTGDPKGFNSVVENASELGELLETYAALPIATRNAWTEPDEFHGALAWRVEVTDDYREFTIYLRKGVMWHQPPNLDLNGKHAWLKGAHEVTANDLIFTLDMILSPQVENGSIKNYYAELESWKAVDSHTVVLRWKKKQYTNISASLEWSPSPEFLYAYDEQGTRFPKETLGLRFNQHWYNNKGFVGAGPYRMTSYQPGVKIELARNEAFSGQKPAIAKIVYPIYSDRNQTLLKLKAREATFADITPGQYREEVQRYDGVAQKPKSPFFDGSIECKKVTLPAYSFVAWNADKPLFADKRVRRAMTHAFDRQRILDSVYVGLGKVTSDPYPPGAPYADPAIQPLPFDLEAARRLLKEAGWTDSDGDGLVDKQLRPGDARRAAFVFSFLVSNSSKEVAALANIYRDDLLKIGVKATIEAAEWSLMQKRMDEKSFDAFAGAWSLPWDTDLFQVWHSSQADVPKGSNRIGFRNKEADVIIENLRTTFGADARVALFRQFHRILHDEQPYTMFRKYELPHCWWRDVKDVTFSKMRPVANSLPWSVARLGG